MRSLTVQSGLRILRKRSGMSQRELAHLLGYERSTISHLERGVRAPASPELLAMEMIFDTIGWSIFPDLSRKVAGKVAQRLEQLRHTDRAAQSRKRIARSRLTDVHLERIAESLRHRMEFGSDVYTMWPIAE